MFLRRTRQSFIFITSPDAATDHGVLTGGSNQVLNVTQKFETFFAPTWVEYYAIYGIVRSKVQPDECPSLRYRASKCRTTLLSTLLTVIIVLLQIEIDGAVESSRDAYLHVGHDVATRW